MSRPLFFSLNVFLANDSRSLRSRSLTFSLMSLLLLPRRVFCASGMLPQCRDCLDTWISRSPSRTVMSSLSSSRSSDLKLRAPLGTPARVATSPRAKLMLAGRSFVAGGVGLFVLSHCATPLFFFSCDLNTRAAPRWASRTSAEQFCLTGRKGSSLGGRGGVAHYRSAMHTRREPAADAALPCSVWLLIQRSAAASSALAFPSDATKAVAGQS